MLKIVNPVILFIFLPLLSLSQPLEHGDKRSRFPFVIDMLPEPNKKSVAYKTTVSQTRFTYTGKHMDTLELSADAKPYFNMLLKTYHDSLGIIRFYADSVLKKSGLSISVDPSQNLSIDQTPFPSTVYIPSEGYKVYSIQTKKNYQEWLKLPRDLIEAMPVFISNNTYDTVFLDYQDLHAFMIQEAVDEDGKWWPIEYWQYSKCGNSYNATGILPHELIVVKVVRHSGSFETLMRLKLINGKQIIYSNAFKGSINKEQFAADTLINKKFVYNDPFLNRPGR